MAYALTKYTGNNSTTTYTIGFTYRSTDDVVVTLDGVTKTITTHYTFPTSSQIQFGTAPANGVAIQFTRSTSQTTRLVDYQAGSVFKESDLDTDSIQSFNMAQEAIDKANDALAKTLTNVYDAGSVRITNVADPTSAQDASTKAYVDSQISTGATNATNAANSATAASTSETNAGNSATAATNAKNAAETARDASVTAKTASETAKTASETAQSASESARDTSVTAKNDSVTAKTASETAKTASETARDASVTAKTASETAKTASETAETLSQNWAVKVNGEVETGEGYSSKAWALGGTGVTDTAGSGSAKEWATDTTNQVDGTEYSAKEWAIGSQSGQSNGSAKQWAIGGGGSYATNTAVSGGVYSAKYYAEQAAASADSVDDSYLGAKSSDPSVDNDGNALQTGALYYNSSSTDLKVWNGSAWEVAAVSTTGLPTAGFTIAMSIAL
tara:strand:+ start:9500 stop:10843 length:1344 start_codon:yes stop_codon:yes gene_type:complete